MPEKVSDPVKKPHSKEYETKPVDTKDIIENIKDAEFKELLLRFEKTVISKNTQQDKPR
jgi:hypothetical protein